MGYVNVQNSFRDYMLDTWITSCGSSEAYNYRLGCSWVGSSVKGPALYPVFLSGLSID